MFYKRHFPAIRDKDKPVLRKTGGHEERVRRESHVPLLNREGDNREQEVQTPMDQI